MDSLTAFLMDQHGAEMSLDALTDSMLANLPHAPNSFDAAAPIVPFNSNFGKTADYPSVKQQFSQQYQTPWDFPVPPADYAQAASLPMDFGQQPTSSPLFAAPEETIFSNTTATPAAAPAPPKKLQHTSSSCSSDSKEDQEISKLQERIQKQKEKNARNQREFRRRAKERASKIEEQVQHLTAKLSETELEKQSLAAKNRVLEAALASARSYSNQGSNTASPGSILGTFACEEAEDASGPVVLTVRDGSPLQLSLDQIKRMTWQELSRIWKEYVNAIAMRLVTATSKFNGTSEQRLTELVVEVSNLMRTIALHNAMLLHQHHSHRMDFPPNAPQAKQPPSLGTYTNLLEVLGLSKEQKEQMLAHRHVKLVSLARLVQERRELQARLQACNEATANPRENESVGMGAEFPHLLEVAERLRENVSQLHRSVCLFMGHTWRQVLTPVQAGTFMVQAFPWTPDMLALANTIAAEAGAPSVQDIFRDSLSPQPGATLLQLGC